MKAFRLLGTLIFCHAIAHAQTTTRSMINIDRCDTTSQGVLLRDIQQIQTTKRTDATDRWQLNVETTTPEKNISLPTDSIRQLRITQLQVPDSTTVGLRIMQFNIREDKQTEPDYNTFTGVRAEAIKQMLKDVKPDIVCLQECRKTQAQYLATALPEYTQILFPKDGIEKNGGQRDVILYDNKKVRLLTWSKFWFSETPTVSSMSWDASTPKLTIYAKFRSREDTTKDFYVYCTHFPPSAPEAMGHAVTMIEESINKTTSGTLPVFLCGDLNLDYHNAILAPLEEYMYHAASTALASDGVDAITYNGYRDTNLKTLDHIFYRNAIVDTYHVKNKTYQYGTNCKWISDHYPLYSDVRF
ncbi:MAG: endonuclease/exonuclease/phosphatase family protein [Bacteroidaceae bacterium]|nr:endonuclease/exonuclease/phosphatase family protein [Bacteroidaceae bacterium]